MIPKPTFRACFVAAVAAFLIIGGVGIISAQNTLAQVAPDSQSQYAQGSPDLDVYIPDNELTPGTEYRSETEDSFSIQIDND